MKTNILITISFLIFCLTAGYSQRTTQDKKADKAEKKAELQLQIEKLIITKQFVFVASRALPMSGSSIDLTTNSNYVKFSPYNIESYMPFFGQAYSVDYNVDPGVQFEGEPEYFTIKKLKKNRGYDVMAKVSLARDTYDLHLDVGLEGNSTLTISSYNRSSISYIGQIYALDQPKEGTKK
jgi:hypothetical protein